MTDLEERLRDAAMVKSSGILPSRKLYIEAADRIKELEEALREAERVRDEWCAEYVYLRDCRKVP